MRPRVILVVISASLGLLLSRTLQAATELTNVAAAVHYTPPIKFYETLSSDRNDPGDDPSSLKGPTFLEYSDSNDPCGLVAFELGWVGAYAGEGKVIKFLPVGPTSLKEYLDLEYRSKFPEGPPATITKIGGLPAASLTVTRPLGPIRPYFLQFCWIQLETNAAVKITACSCNAETFKALTNSLSSITIDKARLLAIIKSTQTDVANFRLQKVDIGYILWHGQRAAALVLHTEGKLFSFVAKDTSKPDEVVKRCADRLGKLRDLSGQPNFVRMVVIDMRRSELAADQVERTCSFITEAGTETLRSLGRPDFRVPPSLAIAEFWENKEPDGFEKVGEYELKALLFIQKKGL